MLSAPIPIPDTSPCATSAEPPLSLEHALQEFIAVKSAEALRPLTVKQLRQRIGHFVVAMDNKLLRTVTSADIANYVTTLNQEGRSAKSNKEYMAAIVASSEDVRWVTRLVLYH